MKRETVSLHNNIKWVTTAMQFLAMFPVENVRAENSDYLNFRFFSCGFFYFTFCWSCVTCIGVLYVILMITYYGVQIWSIVHVAEMWAGLSTGLLGLNVARNWPKLMKKWKHMENAMEKYEVPRNFKLKLHVLLTGVAVIIMLEYILYHVASHAVTTACQKVLNITDPEVYLVRTYKELFFYLPKNVFVAAICEFFRSVCVLSMSWTNLLLVAISYSLAMRFKQINMALEGGRCDEGFWRMIREDYTVLSEVCKDTDGVVEYLTLFCFAHNVIYILLTVTFIFKEADNTITFFFLSFILLEKIIYVIVISFSSGRMYDESKKPLNYICSAIVGPAAFAELKRFVFQAAHQEHCLTGARFFNITKTTVLEIAGVVLSYEFVVLQIKKYSEVDLNDGS